VKNCLLHNGTQSSLVYTATAEVIDGVVSSTCARYLGLFNVHRQWLIDLTMWSQVQRTVSWCFDVLRLFVSYARFFDLLTATFKGLATGLLQQRDGWPSGLRNPQILYAAARLR